MYICAFAISHEGSTVYYTELPAKEEYTDTAEMKSSKYIQAVLSVTVNTCKIKSDLAVTNQNPIICAWCQLVY